MLAITLRHSLIPDIVSIPARTKALENPGWAAGLAEAVAAGGVAADAGFGRVSLI